MNTNEHTVSMETRRKISKSMKGRSNFKGKHHTPDSKDKISKARGHADRIKGRKWRTDKTTGDESRVFSRGSSTRYRWGRNITEDATDPQIRMEIRNKSGYTGIITLRYDPPFDAWFDSIESGPFADADFGQTEIPNSPSDSPRDIVVKYQRVISPLGYKVVRYTTRSIEPTFEQFISSCLRESFYISKLTPSNNFAIAKVTKDSLWIAESIAGTSFHIRAQSATRTPEQVTTNVSLNHKDCSIARHETLEEAISFITTQSTTQSLNEHDGKNPIFFYVLTPYGQSYLLAELSLNANGWWRTIRLSGIVPKNWHSSVESPNLSKEDVQKSIKAQHPASQFFSNHHDAYKALRNLPVTESIQPQSDIFTPTEYATIASALSPIKEAAYNFLDSAYVIPLAEEMKVQPLSPRVQTTFQIFSTLHELSTEKLAKYKTAAAKDASEADKKQDFKRGDKRFRGMIKATIKQFDNDAKKPLQNN